MGGGKPKSVSTSGPSPEQRETERFFLEDISKPIAGVLIPQVLEAMTTGGVGARIPLVQKSVEQSRAGTSRALANTQQQLALAKLLSTPFGARTLAQTRQAGELATESISPQMAAAFANIAPDLLMGGGKISVSGPGESKTVQRGGGADVFGQLAQAGSTLGAAWMLRPTPTPATGAADFSAAIEAMLT